MDRSGRVYIQTFSGEGPGSPSREPYRPREGRRRYGVRRTVTGESCPKGSTQGFSRPVMGPGRGKDRGRSDVRTPRTYIRIQVASVRTRYLESSGLGSWDFQIYGRPLRPGTTERSLVRDRCRGDPSHGERRVMGLYHPFL